MKQVICESFAALFMLSSYRGVVLQTEAVSAHVLLFNVPQDNISQAMQTCISSQMSESCHANANVREIQVTTTDIFWSPNIF